MPKERKEGLRQAGLARELEMLCKKHKRLTRELVVEYAQTHKNSFLHKEFEWDVPSAAYQHWLDRAGELIRYITIRKQVGSRIIKAPMYVHDPDIPTNVGGYVPTLTDRSFQSARQIMLEELRRCEQAIGRARNVCGALGVQHAGIESELESMLEHLVIIRGAIAA